MPAERGEVPRRVQPPGAADVDEVEGTTARGRDDRDTARHRLLDGLAERLELARVDEHVHARHSAGQVGTLELPGEHRAGQGPGQPVPVGPVAHQDEPGAGEVRDGREVTEKDWQSVRARLMTAYLLHTPEGATKPGLAEAIYPGEDPSDATMGMTLMRLRKALEPGLERGQPSRYLLRTDGRYRFNGEAHIELDTRAFDQALAAARGAAPAAERAWLGQALQLYAGDFVPECEAPWAVALRQAYRLDARLQPLA